MPMRMPTIGELRNRVRLELPVATKDTHGGSVIVWTLLAWDWAAIWPISGREMTLAQQMTSVLSSVAWIRYRTDFSAKGRIVFGTRTLQVEALDDPAGTRQFLRLICAEVGA